jgi:hypothetical protein
VLGGQNDLKEVIMKHRVKEVIVSFRENAPEKVEMVKKIIAETGTEVEVRQMKLIFS